MKPTLLNPALASIALALVCQAAVAQSSITLNNPDFELPATAKIKLGYDVSGSDVPGWLNTGGSYVDTGVESGGSHGGSWRAFARSTDGGGYQIANYQMQLGDTLSLTWWGVDGWNNSAQTVNLLSAGSLSDAFGSTSVLTSQVNGLTGSWTQYTLNYTATAADVGKYVGISFINSSSIQYNWAAWDDFSLTVTAVPEPTTGALAGLSLLLGVLKLRRRQN